MIGFLKKGNFLALSQRRYISLLTAIKLAASLIEMNESIWNPPKKLQKITQLYTSLSKI